MQFKTPGHKTRHKILQNAFLAAALLGVILVVGCQVEKMPSREQVAAKKDAQTSSGGAVTYIPVPTTDNAADIIAACGPAASDQIVAVNDKLNNGSLRRMIYRSSREVTLDFVPLQPAPANPPPANTVWKFNQAVVDNQRLVTAANIKIYLPCAAGALAKEF